MMSFMELKKDGDVHILTLTNGKEQNSLTDSVIEEFHGVLDTLERYEGNTALIIKSSDGKCWNTGVNLKWIANRPADYMNQFRGMLEKMLLRFAVLNMPTVGCLNGHAYGIGAMLAITLDFRFMRADRGFICFPAIDHHRSYSLILHQVLDLLPNRMALTELLLTGKRIGGMEAQEKKVVTAAYALDELWSKSIAWAHMLAAKDRQTYSTIKLNMRKPLVESWKMLQGKRIGLRRA